MINIKHLALVIVWAIVLFVFTCTTNLDALIFHQNVHFRWVAHPDFRELFITSDAHPFEASWLIIKLGHFLGFAIFEILLYQIVRKHSVAAAGSIFYAASTEILQLYFSRDGRLLDMAIDSAGVVLSYCLQRPNRLAATMNRLLNGSKK